VTLHIADLPAFGQTLRSYASKAFFIGRGFKNDDADQPKWLKYGASWIISEDKGLTIQADAQANRRYGDALNDLGRSLQRLGARSDQRTHQGSAGGCKSPWRHFGSYRAVQSTPAHWRAPSSSQSVPSPFKACHQRAHGPGLEPAVDGRTVE